MRALVPALALCLANASLLSAENWPQWRGPLGNGHSPEKGLAERWSLDTAAWKPVTLAGNINEALDIWAHARPMPELREGDRIAFLNAGGYGASMSSNHCMRGAFTEMLLSA